MKILLVIDGSSHSGMTTQMLQALRLTPQTEVAVMTVVPEHSFLGGITLNMLRGTDRAQREGQREKALELLENHVKILSETGLKVESMVQWGNPAEVIVRMAKQIDASLVVMGAKGLTDSLAFRLGSVAINVMKHASCSVLLVRRKTVSIGKNSLTEKKAVSVNRVLLATDGSKYADAAAQLLLDLPIPSSTDVIIVTILQSHLDTLMKTPTLDLHTNQELFASLQEAEEVEARKIIARSTEQFKSKGYKASALIMRGGAGESILKAAEEHDPDMIAIGSKGLTGIESLFLGSVAERVARYANCSVLIGRTHT